MRNMPLIRKYYSRKNEVPSLIALGMAAYIIFMNATQNGADYVANVNGKNYPVQDEFAEILYKYWQNPETAIDNILADRRLWDENLNDYPGFNAAIRNYVDLLQNTGAKRTLSNLHAERTI